MYLIMDPKKIRLALLAFIRKRIVRSGLRWGEFVWESTKNNFPAVLGGFQIDRIITSFMSSNPFRFRYTLHFSNFVCSRFCYFLVLLFLVSIFARFYCSLFQPIQYALSPVTDFFHVLVFFPSCLAQLPSTLSLQPLPFRLSFVKWIFALLQLASLCTTVVLVLIIAA